MPQWLSLFLLAAMAAAKPAAMAAGCGQFVVASQPTSAAGGLSRHFRVLRWDNATSALAAVGTFAMGDVTEDGVIAFSADGMFGVAAQKNGTVGVFQLDCATGAATVLAARLALPDYVDTPTRDPLDGDRFWLLGDAAVYGLYVNRSAPGGPAVVSEGLYLAAKQPAALRFVAPPAAAVAAAATAATAAAAAPLAVLVVADGVVLVVDWAARRVLATQAAFPYPEAIVSDACVLPSLDAAGAHVLLLLDDDQFGVRPPSLAAVRLAGLASAAPAVTPLQLVPRLNDPAALACSPWGTAAVLALDEGNALLQLRVADAAAAAPVNVTGPLAYKGAPPQLPSALVSAAAPAGRVFVAELSGIRQLQFDAATGAVADLGLFSFGPGLADMCGAIGVNF
jgi:hypothetical protein